MSAVLSINSIQDIVEFYKGRLVFKPGILWPSIYHLRLLAFTHRWRTPENHTRITQAIKRLIDLSPIPDIHLRHKSQIIAPASFCMHNFDPDIDTMKDSQWMEWFHSLECLSRLGVVPAIPRLQVQVERLQSLLDSDQGWFNRRLSHPCFTKWGAYTGLILEPDWRSSRNRINDLTFRSLLILYYSSKVKWKFDL